MVGDPESHEYRDWQRFFTPLPDGVNLVAIIGERGVGDTATAFIIDDIKATSCAYFCRYYIITGRIVPRVIGHFRRGKTGGGKFLGP